MDEDIRLALEGVARTSLMTLYSRARESKQPNALIRDAIAEQIAEKIGPDTTNLHLRRHNEIALLMRTNRFDNQVRGFLERNPDGVVVHLGCGLDTRFQRVDNGRVVWFDLDLPEVIAARQRLFPAVPERVHSIGQSVLEDDWLGEVEKCKPQWVMFVAEGMFVYFEESQVRTLVIKLQDHFPGCELVCDASSALVNWLDNLVLAARRLQARLHWSIKSPRELESWGEGIHLVEEWNYYKSQRSEFKKDLVLRILGPLWKGSGIYRYQLGKPL